MVPKTILILLLAAAMGACATTGSEQQVGDEATAAKEPKQKMSCRRDKSTGSRLGERICTPVGD